MVTKIYEFVTCLIFFTFFFSVVGLGFGMMSGAFSLVNVLADSIGPGTVGFNNEPQDFFMVSALQGMAMILLQTFWGIITFDALDGKKWIYLAYVWVTHLLVSCLVSTHRGKTKNYVFT